MGRVIDLEERRNRPPDNLISSKPMEFRRAMWDNSEFIMMLRPFSEGLERRRAINFREGRAGVSSLPPHHVLRGGMSHTVRGLYLNRESESAMKEVYYLAGLVDCMINQVSPLLRTDLIRDLYRKVLELKQALNVSWLGPIDQVLFPVDSQFYNFAEYRESLRRAQSLKELYEAIQEGVGDMFSILCANYVFYTPGRGEGPNRR